MQKPNPTGEWIIKQHITSNLQPHPNGEPVSSARHPSGILYTIDGSRAAAGHAGSVGLEEQTATSRRRGTLRIRMLQSVEA
jgi:hypothetical protein